MKMRALTAYIEENPRYPIVVVFILKMDMDMGLKNKKGQQIGKIRV